MSAESVRGRAWEALVSALKARHPSRFVCTLCGGQIDHSLKNRHPMMFSADHIIPQKTRPDLAMVYSNLQPAHLRCNIRKGDRDRMPDAPTIRRHYRARNL